MNLEFRPDYFDDATSAFIATIKGEVRKRELLNRINGGDVSELEDWLIKSKLGDDERESLSSIHPALMGGEYLPDFLPGEVEIARMSIESVTADVISVRARLSGGKICYRIVDEYESRIVNHPTESDLPLTLGALIELIDTAEGDLPCSPAALWENQCAVGSALEEIESFVTVSSEFYREIQECYEERFDEWLEGKKESSAKTPTDPRQLELDLAAQSDSRGK